MNKSNTRRIEVIIVALALISIMAILFSTKADAALSWPGMSESGYCEFISSKAINVYRDTGLKTRGTCSPAKSYNASIAIKDDCRIYKITGDYIKVNYPTSSGRRTGYIKRSDLISVAAPTKVSTSLGKVTTYKKAGGDSYGYTEAGDTIYTVGTSGSYTAIIYTAKSGSQAFKYGFVKTADHNSITATKITVNSGNFTLKKQGTKSITATVINGSGNTTWKSEKTGVATVSAGTGTTITVKAIGEGSSKITAANNGKTVSITVTVPGNGTIIKLDTGNCTLTTGSSKKITATVTNGVGSITWKNSNTKAATISTTTGNSVTVKAIAQGETTITATNNGVSASVTIKVYTPPQNILVSSAEIERAANAYSISKNSNAYKALELINTKYGAKLIKCTSTPLVFLFEGVNKNNPGKYERENAMCVVVSGGKITYINRRSNTIPDNPFRYQTDNGKYVPTLISGIYDYVSHNHKADYKKRYQPYASLNVKNAKVLRHKSSKAESASGINVHGRGGSKVDASTSNSLGCQLVGRCFLQYPSEFANFIKAVGVVHKNTKVTLYTKYEVKVEGKIVIDRTFAKAFLKTIGYSDKAINIIGAG